MSSEHCKRKETLLSLRKIFYLNGFSKVLVLVGVECKVAMWVLLTLPAFHARTAGQLGKLSQILEKNLEMHPMYPILSP